MTFEIYKLEWILSRHTFGNTTYHNFIITTFGNVPADLRSAGIEYKDLMIRLKYRCITKVNNEKFNAMFALKV